MKDPELVLRELKEPDEVVASIRLRHRVYFEERGYGATKPLNLDLTAYDPRSRLFGLFRDGQLVGGLRLVFRDDQPLAAVMRTIRAVVGDVVSEQRASTLPSEEALDLAAEPGMTRELVEVEVGRLVVSRGAVSASVVLRMMVATLSVLISSNVHLYMYSCAVGMARRYAIVTRPRWTHALLEHKGIHSDGFEFPSRSCVAIASPPDSPFYELARSYVDEFVETGSITLSAALPKPGACVRVDANVAV